MESMDVETAKVKAAEAAAKAKEEAQKIYDIAKEQGYFSHFKEYSMELLTPWIIVTSNSEFMELPTMKEKALYMALKAKEEVVSTVTLNRPADVVSSFKLYNVLAFWLGVTESVLGAVFGGSLFSLVWNGGIAFIVAYTLYWIMTCLQEPKIMKYGMIFIVLYIAFNVYMGIKGLLFVVPALFYFGKALCDVLMLINGYYMIKDKVGDDQVFML